MNKVQLVGRLTRDPETKYTTGENATAVTRFSLALDRRFKREGDEQTADFVNVVAFSKTGEFVQKYFTKGKPIGISGRLQSGKYVNKDGNTVYTLDVVSEEVEFVGNKSDNGDTGSAPATAKPSEEFMSVSDEVESELPFN